MTEPPVRGDRPRILFTTSNGTGLGHLTRSMAIARRLGDRAEPLFLTLSAAAPVVESMGFPVEYVASYATPGAGNDYRWSRRLRARLRAVINEAEPDLIVFDGTHPYEALLGALPSAGTAVWCRRPLWRRGASRVPLNRAGAFDAVIEPGELAESEDVGPTVALRERAHRVGPIVLLDREELLDRAAAAAELGLDPGRPAVLVTLGQGAEVREATRRTLARLTAGGDVQVAALSSALTAADEVPEGVIDLRATYPMSRYFAAFDGAVAAAGYNAYHELIELGVPSLFVPMARRTDDQPARARYADRAGIGLGVDGPTDPRLEAQLDRLLDPGERAAIAANLHALPPATGARDAAAWLTAGAPAHPADGLKTLEGATESTRRRGGKEFRRRWGSFFGSLPQTAYRLTKQQLTKPRARALVFAVGIEPERVAEAVRAAAAEAGERPERTLVVTDALRALGELRALGVGVEHIPAASSREAQLSGLAYDDFVAERMALIRAERPRPRKVVAARGGLAVPSVP